VNTEIITNRSTNGSNTINPTHSTMIKKHDSRHALKLLISLLAVLLLSACDEAKLTPLPHDGVILAFGDSLTVGVGTSASNSYPAVLTQLTGLQVINRGISGETTAGGLQRLASVLSETNPDLLILIEGGNDILRNKKSAQTKANLAAMIKLTQNQNIAVVLLGIPEKKLFSNSAPFYEELAEEFELVFDPDLMTGLLRTPSYKSDPIHLNDQGYKKMAEGIRDLLSENGALK